MIPMSTNEFLRKLEANMLKKCDKLMNILVQGIWLVLDGFFLLFFFFFYWQEDNWLLVDVIKECLPVFETLSAI